MNKLLIFTIGALFGSFITKKLYDYIQIREFENDIFLNI